MEQAVTFTQPGLYQPKVIVTNDVGDTFEASTVVLVEDAVAIEAMLNAQWAGMMDALAQGDIENSVRNLYLSIISCSCIIFILFMYSAMV